MGAFTLPPSSYSGAANIPATTPFKYGPETRIRHYERGWKENELQDATHFITAKIPKEVKEELRVKGRPVTDYVTKLLKGIVRCVTNGDPSYQPDYIWVLEPKNGVHVHIAIRLSSYEVVLAVESYLAEQFGVKRTERGLGCAEIRKHNSGLPIHITPISLAKVYTKTERAGFDGLLDYFKKKISENAQRRKGADLGKLVGASQSVTQRR